MSARFAPIFKFVFSNKTCNSSESSEPLTCYVYIAFLITLGFKILASGLRFLDSSISLSILADRVSLDMGTSGRHPYLESFPFLVFRFLLEAFESDLPSAIFE